MTQRAFLTNANFAMNLISIHFEIEKEFFLKQKR
jgi:hypothetical protein